MKCLRSSISSAAAGLRSRVADLPFYLALLALAWGLKRWYSLAQAQDLMWLLRPLAALTGWALGVPFVPEGGVGFVNNELAIMIVPSCAGVNFLIIALLSAGFTAIGRLPSPVLKAAALAGLLPGAYGLTLIANSLRILLSIHLYEADIYAGWITPERVHRLAGVVLYLGCLLLLINGLRRLLPHPTDRGRNPPSEGNMPATAGFAWAPLFWYGAFLVGVPLVNGTYRQSTALFTEHCLTIGAAYAVLPVLMVLLRTALRRKGHAPQSPDRRG